MRYLKKLLCFGTLLLFILAISATAYAADITGSYVSADSRVNGTANSQASGIKDEVKYLPQINFNELKQRALPYQDVEKGSWPYLFISYLNKLNVINGVSATAFAPNQNVTRSEFAKFLASVKTNYTGDMKNALPFTDVPKDMWYTPYIHWAYENGIIEGKTATTFCPDEFITREEAATMMYRFVGKEKFKTDGHFGEYVFMPNYHNSFNDADTISAYAKDAVIFLNKTSLLIGDENFNFKPQNNMKRGEVAKILTIYLTTVTKPDLLSDYGPPLVWSGN